ncbi:MAG: hypothetical protein WC346_02970 [Methanogenium sp.]|jgi:hypothetical protein
MEKGWFKIKLGKLEIPFVRFATIREGEKPAPWYYGLAYTEFYKYTSVWYPIPINYIVRLSMKLKYRWDLHRSKPSWVDKQFTQYMKAFNKDLDEKHAKLNRELMHIDRLLRNVNEVMVYVVAEKEKIRLAKEIMNSMEVKSNG